MNYDDTVSYIFGLRKFGSKPGLSAINRLLELIGNPEKETKVILVGGTNGKGSTCAMIHSILKEAGYKVGLFTSPHLHTFRERIRINDELVSKKEVTELFEKLKEKAEKMKNEKNMRFPTASEMITAMAFKYFADKKVDFAVFEVMMGGKYDATNVTVPLVSVITNVTLDHTHILGETIEKIADDKSNIIKGNIAVTSAKSPALEIIKEKCRKNNAELISVGEDIIYKKINSSLNKQKFSINGNLNNYENLELPLLGEHQLINAATAVGIKEALVKQKVKIPKKAIIKGLKNTKWEGRLEIIKKNPLIVIDDAHNPDGMKKLRVALQSIFSYNNLILVLGISSNKDIKTMVKTIVPLASKVIITKAEWRGIDLKTLKKEVSKYCKDVIEKEKVGDAARYAESIAKNSDLVCVCGSIFVLDEARRIWKDVEVDKYNLNFI